MSFRGAWLVGIGLGVAVGCAAPASKEPVGDSFDALASLDEKSDQFTSRFRMLGSIAYGETASNEYRGRPRYLGYRFDGTAGDEVSAWVRSSDGDPVGWIVSNRYQILAVNDDADSTTYDSHVELTLPTTGRYYLVMRDYSFSTAHFDVALDLAAPVTQCEYNGSTYEVGDSFPSTDGCNTCSCSEGGAVGCTKRACLDEENVDAGSSDAGAACNPENEPHRQYAATNPETCARIRFVCAAETRYFSNDCGCGCESAN